MIICLCACAAAALSCDSVVKPGKNIPITSMKPIADGVEIMAYHVSNVDSVMYFTIEVEPKNATEEISWELGNSEIVSEYTEGDALGRTKSFKAINAGDVTVVLTTASGLKRDFYITVYPNPVAVEGLSLDQKELTIKVGDSAVLTAYLNPVDADGEVGWEIEDPTILDYDWEEQREYYFSALKTGKTKVTATCDEFRAECVVTVLSNIVPLTGVSLSPSSFTVHEGDQFEISPVFTPSNASNKAMTWEVEKPDLVTVEGCRGGVTDLIARKYGTTKLVGTSRDGGFKVTATVKINPPIPPDGAVDLGYRYGDNPVYFSKYNLGSTSLHTPGELYAWGDKEVYYEKSGAITIWKAGKERGYSKESYKWYDESTKKYTKYSGGTGDISIRLEDDPAYNLLGGCWRMPNPADLWWLINKCTWLVDYDNLSYIVKSEVEGFEDQTITIPMTGYYVGREFLGYGQVDGTSIYPFSVVLASSCLHYNGDLTYNVDKIETAFASMIVINDKLYNDYRMSKEDRFHGFTIRPVWQTGLKK